MKYFVITISLLAFIILSLECDIFDREEAVAKVGGSKLNQSLLETIVPKIGNDDEYKKTQWKFINDWVDMELLYNEALKNDITSNEFIDYEVDRVKKSLIVNMFLNKHFGDILDVSDKDIETYYQEHLNDYIAGENIYRIAGLKTSDTQFASQLTKDLTPQSNVRSVFTNSPTQCSIVSNGADLLGESNFPAEFAAELQKMINKEDFSRFSYIDEIYFVKILDFIPEGEPKPLEFVKSEVQQICIHNKRLESYQKMVSGLRRNNPYEIIFDFPSNSEDHR
ncbi:hypothetical protein ACFL7D_08575 [candidate division KSB1 bacterium]